MNNEYEEIIKDSINSMERLIEKEGKETGYSQGRILGVSQCLFILRKRYTEAKQRDFEEVGEKLRHMEARLDMFRDTDENYREFKKTIRKLKNIRDELKRIRIN